MEHLIAEAIDLGDAFPGRSSAQFVRVNGRKLRLQDEDGKLTEVGYTYWRLKGLDPPEFYPFDQPVVNGHVVGYDGRPIKVHTRLGKVTSKGLAYYRYHQCNITIGVPCLPVIDGEVMESAGSYLPFSVSVPFVKYIDPLHFLASETDLQIMAERAVLERLPQGQISLGGKQYVELPADGDHERAMLLQGCERDITYIWDHSRAMRLERRSMLPCAPPTTDDILGRALS